MSDEPEQGRLDMEMELGKIRDELSSVHDETTSNPRKYDVIFGRGSTIRDLPSNVRYRDIIKRFLQEYKAAIKNADKRTIARKIRLAVEEGGEDADGERPRRGRVRFLVPLPDGRYAILTDPDAIEATFVQRHCERNPLPWARHMWNMCCRNRRQSQ